jgi:hypothetical protein
MIRPLNDRVAEAMRRERLGPLLGHIWRDFEPGEKADWLGRADHLIRIFKELGVDVAVKE